MTDLSAGISHRNSALWFAAGCQLLAMLSWFSFSGMEPAISREWGLTERQVGGILAAFQGGYCAFVLLAGHLADRFDPKKVMVAGMAVAGAAQIGFALQASGFAAAILWRVLTAVGLAGVYIPGLRYLGTHFEPKRLGKVYGIYVGALVLGSGGSLLFIGPLLTLFIWRDVSFAIGLAGLAAAAVMAFAPASGARQAPMPAVTPVRENSRGMLRTLFGNPLFVMFVFGYVLHMWELYAFWGWINPFFYRALSPAMGEVWPTLLGGLAIVLGALGTWLGGWLSDRFGRVKVLIPLQAASVALAGTFGWLMLSPAAATAAGMIYGLIVVADSPIFSAGVANNVEPRYAGFALSLQQVLGYVVTVVSPLAVGWTLGAFGNTPAGWGIAFGVLGLGPLLAVPLLFVLTGIAKRQGRIIA